MNITPQVETAEISDADLDFVSGGNAANLSGDVTVQTSVGDVYITAVGDVSVDAYAGAGVSAAAAL